MSVAPFYAKVGEYDCGVERHQHRNHDGKHDEYDEVPLDVLARFRSAEDRVEQQRRRSERSREEDDPSCKKQKSRKFVPQIEQRHAQPHRFRKTADEKQCEKDHFR